jgi:hypothetical protein
MENIGNKDSAIAERLRALLAAANNKVVVAVTPVASGSTPPVIVPWDPQRLDPNADPARVVANLRADSIQLVVSILFLYMLSLIRDIKTERHLNPGSGTKNPDPGFQDRFRIWFRLKVL